MKKVKLIALDYWPDGRATLESKQNLGEILEVNYVLDFTDKPISVKLPDGRQYMVSHEMVEVIE